MELYKKYRPRSLKQMIGQPSAVKVLTKMVKQNKVPHALLFSGPSGCGKTTFARILRRKLKCGRHDFTEVNCADFRGIDMVRDIRSHLQQVAISGDCRIWLIDEAHKLSNDAQNAFLKMLEDTPNHIYFILATTNSQKLLKTIRTRCTEIVVKSLNSRSLSNLIKVVLDGEKMEISDEIVEKIIDNSDGSGRKALVLLDQIINLEDEEDMLEAIKGTVAEIQGIAVARALHNPRTKWKEMSRVLKETADEDPEQIRWIVMGYAKTILLSGSKLSDRAYLVLDAFRDNFYDSKQSGLVAACYEIIHGAK